VVVASTYHWSWLVAGLMDRGYVVHVANTAAIQQDAGLKYTDDHSDARWLAHLLRLGVLPTGHMDPKEERAVRDLLRTRTQWVQHKTTHVLSIQTLCTRNTGGSIRSNRIKQRTAEDIDEILPEPALALAQENSPSACWKRTWPDDPTRAPRVKLRVAFKTSSP
jgi:transposase